ncbi:cyclodeaminase [Sneathiella chinensis]|uniref:Cyclodeaminase n=1 Tax=Sneathiella chinensis TaxID=349750 RepID=A0ABQ5U0V2_9PROT|nr:cyclodeaminase [Sneathiella chinensis]GLQ04825.1 cyclodeaminase [Sneathiella chinensis]
MDHSIRILTEEMLRACVPLDRQAISLVGNAFSALSGGAVVMPPVLSMNLPEVHGEVDIKTAYIPGFNEFAIKVSPGFFDNPALGLPSLNGLMVVLSARTGIVEAVLLDNGYLTNVRTAAAGGVAADCLAPKVVQTAGVIGTGVQARLQMKAAHLVRSFERVIVWGRDRGKAEQCARDLQQDLGIPAEVSDSAADLVARCQLVVTTTPATEPVLQANWLHPGLHITAMGSDQSGKNELDPDILARADLYVCDNQRQCETLGELRTAQAAGYLVGSSLPELGAIVRGAVSGRVSEEAVTVCDLTGTGAQDTAIAAHALAQAAKADQGFSVPARIG